MDIMSDGEIVDENVSEGAEAEAAACAPRPTESQNQELFQIVFKTNEAMTKYKSSVKSSIQRSMLQDNNVIVNFVENGNEVNVIYEEECEENSIFQIDTNSSTNSKIDPVNIPSYKRSTKDIFDGTFEETYDKKNNFATPKSNLCFNCSSAEHSIRNCPEQKNHSRINKAKKLLSVNKGDRYHIDVEQRFAHLRPGKISDYLKNALGIKKNEIPHFYYRMRLFGYPPGWLEESKVCHSGISMFDSPGVEVSEPDEEEGEVDVEKYKYDISKIIGFPGYNIMPSEIFVDDYNHHGVPPIDPEDAKDKFVESFGKNIIKGYKRKKIKTTTVAENVIEDSPQAIENMEVEDVIVLDDTSENTYSKKLLEMKEHESLDIKDACGEVIQHTIVNESSFAPNNKSDRECGKPENIVETLMGTPLLQFSPYDKLPSGHLFQQGVSDVINFENLPDSTGKYKNMEKVIKKVRKVVSKINNENC